MRDEGYANLEAPALDVRSISCGYSPRKLTLHEVSFQVRQGEFVAIIGLTGRERRPCSVPYQASCRSAAVRYG